MKAALFIGYPLTQELKYELHTSTQWKEAQILQQKEKEGLVTFFFDGKEFVGLWIYENPADLSYVESIAGQVLCKLRCFLPHASLEVSNVTFIPQLLIGQQY